MQEHTIFQNVVLLGLTDALGKFQWQSRLNRQYEIEAKDWIGSKDFNLVCSYADLQPGYITKTHALLNSNRHTIFII